MPDSRAIEIFGTDRILLSLTLISQGMQINKWATKIEKIPGAREAEHLEKSGMDS